MTQHWNVVVEYDGTISEDQGVELVGRPADYPIVGIDRAAGRTRVSFGVEASTLRQATDAAWKTARELATGIITGPAQSIRIVTDEQFIVEAKRPPVPDLVDSKGAMEILHVGTLKRFYELQERADFPHAVATLSGNREVFTKASIEAFNQRWAPTRKPGRPRKVQPEPSGE
jgi:hypothetical protein